MNNSLQACAYKEDYLIFQTWAKYIIILNPKTKNKFTLKLRANLQIHKFCISKKKLFIFCSPCEIREYNLSNLLELPRKLSTPHKIYSFKFYKIISHEQNYFAFLFKMNNFILNKNTLKTFSLKYFSDEIILINHTKEIVFVKNNILMVAKISSLKNKLLIDLKKYAGGSDILDMTISVNKENYVYIVLEEKIIGFNLASQLIDRIFGIDDMSQYISFMITRNKEIYLLCRYYTLSRQNIIKNQ